MKIFISARLAPEWVAKLQDYGEVDHYDWGKAGKLLDPQELAQRVADSDIVIVESDELTREILLQAPRLKEIVVCRGTIINVDMQTASELGIMVTHTPGRNADAVADLTVCLMIMIARHVHHAANSMAAGDWVKLGKRDTYLKFQGMEQYGRVAGLVGLGAIGKRVASRLKGFEMQLLAYDPFITADEVEQYGVQLVGLEDLMCRSDFVSLHAAVTPETREMIGEREIRWMKPTAYMINTARAELIAEPALIRALEENRIAGAALDVFLEEPLPLDSPWYRLPNVICTPHVGGASTDVIMHQSRMAVRNVIDFLEGGQPAFVANPNRKGLKSNV